MGAVTCLPSVRAYSTSILPMLVSAESRDCTRWARPRIVVKKLAAAEPEDHAAGKARDELVRVEVFDVGEDRRDGPAHGTPLSTGAPKTVCSLSAAGNPLDQEFCAQSTSALDHASTGWHRARDWGPGNTGRTAIESRPHAQDSRSASARRYVVVGAKEIIRVVPRLDPTELGVLTYPRVTPRLRGPVRRR